MTDPIPDYRAIFAANPQPMWLQDPATGRFLEANDAVTEQLGWTRDEVLRMAVREIRLSPPEGEPAQMPARSMSARPAILGRFWRLLTRQGEEVTATLLTTPVAFAGVDAELVLVTEVGKRQSLIDALRVSERRMDDVQRLAQLGSWEWIVDRDEVIWSDELYRLLGMRPDQLRPTFAGFLERIHPDDRAAVAAVVERTFETQEPFEFEARCVRPDGEVIWLQGYGDVALGSDGRIERMVGTGMDITARRVVDQMKSEFIAVVSHELRTPLTSLRGAIGLLASGVLREKPEKAERMLQIALENTDRLARLINDILDLERIESGDVALEPCACDAGDLMRRAADAMRAAADAAGVTLAVAPVRAPLWADPDRVIQTLTNLLSNAIKFSPQGATVRLDAEPVGGDVRFRVADEGRGIPAELHERIFERFRQVDSSDARDKGGTGLGLAICRSIVTQHGGRIWVESAPGDGASFFVDLPAMPADEAVPADALAAGPHVLVCDDDPGVREVVRAMLEERGYRVSTAASGQQAVDLAAAERPSAILLDLLMPQFSGWETAAALAERAETREIPLVILSVLSPGESDALAVPVADWVEKPLDEASLFGALERALDQREGVSRVLVVEDDRDLASVLATMFERHGVEVAHAASGVEAVDLGRSFRPDLLILDIGLPDGDGFWVADWLRQHERLRAVPIVVYTARDLDAEERRRLDGGRTRFVTKGSITIEDFEREVLCLLSALTTEDPPRVGA